MRVAIMQPYFFPYIGYLQLMGAVDLFIIYDNIKYTKKGWINRNRMLVDGSDAVFSLPLKKDSDTLDVAEREIAGDFNREKLCHRIKGAYGRAPCFGSTFPIIEQVLQHPDTNLFRFIHHSLTAIRLHLGIGTEIKISSTIPIPENAKGQNRVLALCKELGTTTYINSIGGMGLYSPTDFQHEGVELRFLRSTPWEYPQFGHPFVPWLSIMDVLMFNPVDVVREQIRTGFKLLPDQP